MYYVSVVPDTTDSVVAVESPVAAFPSVLRGSFGSLNGLFGIRPLYNFSRKPLPHLLSSSPTSAPIWYDPLNSLVTQNGPVHQNRNFPGMLPIRV